MTPGLMLLVIKLPMITHLELELHFCCRGIITVDRWRKTEKASLTEELCPLAKYLEDSEQTLADETRAMLSQVSGSTL